MEKDKRRHWKLQRHVKALGVAKRYVKAVAVLEKIDGVVVGKTQARA